jgi:RimJ/RimL family protein N-acetyltransferase
MEYPNSHPIINHINKDTYLLVPATGIEITKNNCRTIAEICNETEIYKFLFKTIFKAKKYTLENANNFLEWAHKGWFENKHFVFLLLSKQNNIVGSIDIKSNSIMNPEIGYWCGQNHRGLMINMVLELSKLAAKNNILKLKALVTKENDRSSAVLIRSGFIKNENESINDIINNIFYKTLS